MLVVSKEYANYFRNILIALASKLTNENPKLLLMRNLSRLRHCNISTAYIRYFSRRLNHRHQNIAKYPWKNRQLFSKLHRHISTTARHSTDGTSGAGPWTTSSETDQSKGTGSPRPRHQNGDSQGSGTLQYSRERRSRPSGERTLRLKRKHGNRAAIHLGLKHG